MAENLQFSVGADTAAFHSGIGGMLTGLASLAAAFVSVQSVVNAFSEAIDMGGRLNDLSTRTGETAGNLAVLERAFELNSVSADKLGSAINKMQKNLEEFAGGSKTAAEGFKQLGLGLQDLADKSVTEQLELIGVRLSAINDPALRSATAMAIFGKSGAELLPVLLNFTENLKQAQSQLGSLPEQLDRTAGSVDTLGDNLFAIRSKLTEMAYGFLSEVVPAVNVFTSKLAGIDAAGLGAKLADTLVGAFVNPMKAADLLSESLLLGAKKLGNELVYQVQYWGDTFFNILSTVGLNIIPMLGNNMAGAFEMAVGLLGKGLLTVAQPFMQGIQSALSAIGLGDLIHPEDINGLLQSSEDLMTAGASRIAESANVFQNAFEIAKSHSTVVRQDFFGAEESAKNIAQSFADLQSSGKSTLFDLNTTAENLLGGNADYLTPEQRAMLDDARTKVNQESQLGATGGGGGGKTAAQVQAEITKQLGLIAAAAPTQAIGQSASAQRALVLQKRLDTLVAQGKGGSAEAAALATSIFTQTQIAQGNILTASDKESARQIALDQWMNDTSQSMTDLQFKAEQDILDSKRSDSQAAQDAQKAKAGQAGAGAGPEAKKISLQGMAQSIYSLLQKIEPRIPQNIMA